MAEEANLAEIQRLASSAAEMQAELAFRPTRADIDDLTAVVGSLRNELLAKQQQIDRLQATLNREKCTADKAVETIPIAESEKPAETVENIDATKISAEIDEMFQLDYDEEDDESDSAATEIVRDVSEQQTAAAAEYVRLDDEQRLQVTLQNGTLHALEEELVRAKERWAEVSAEKARLAAQLATVQGKPMRLDLSHAVALFLPIALACLYYLLLPYIS